MKSNSSFYYLMKILEIWKKCKIKRGDINFIKLKKK